MKVVYYRINKYNVPITPWSYLNILEYDVPLVALTPKNV